MRKKVWLHNTVTLLLTGLLALGAFALLYRYDNKYTLRAPVDDRGVTVVNAQMLSAPTYLAAGWELYPDQLLTPEELRSGAYSPVQTFIGEHLSLAPFHESGTPYGGATYRLKLRAVDEPNRPAAATLLLQEVFCACTVYVNGAEVASAGSLSPYKPELVDLALSIPLGEETEVVIHTVNDTHYYSGVTYPPVLGTADALHRLTSTRMVIYGLFCFFSLALALFSAALWIRNLAQDDDRIALWFGLLALSFAVRVSYPFFRAMGSPSVRLLYALEDGAFFFGLWCAVNIALCFSGMGKAPLGRAISRITCAAVLVGTLFPPLCLPLLASMTPIYGQLVFWYKAVTAVLLAVLVLYGALHGCRHSVWLMAGVGVYGASLFTHVLFLSRFEPARTAWQDEYGMFALVLCFGVVMVRRSYELVRENLRLGAHLQEEVAEKTHRLNTLLEERRQFLAGAAHDLKAPMTSLQLYAQAVEDGDVPLDEETLVNLRMIRRKSAEMQERLGEIQSFAAEDAQPRRSEPLDLRPLVQAFYEANLPDIEVAGVSCTLSMPPRPCLILGDSQQLGRILQNIVYNALSFTPMDGAIKISLDIEKDDAVLEIADTGCGIAAEDLPHIFDRFFSRREDSEGSGLGLYLVKMFVMEHGGEITARSEPGSGTVIELRFPLLRRRASDFGGGTAGE